MTVLSPTRAAAAATVAWILVAFVARAVVDDQLAAFLPAAQLVALVATVVFAAVTVARRDAFERLASA
ncbi:MAG: hypothetical protein ABJH68_15770 [Ilumatobacter sp.]|uniref:hypothetical protein n=1 Tax=Ilumatobacter sp. TaxID=1967498 RepID=UPI0032977B3A